MPMKLKLTTFVGVLAAALFLIPAGGGSLGACYPLTICQCDDEYIACSGRCEEDPSPYSTWEECFFAECDEQYSQCGANACSWVC
jgi:hypothetical protein